MELSELTQTNLNLETLSFFLSHYAEKSDNVYWLSNPDFSSIVYISPAYEKIWGRKSTELINRPGLWLEALVLEKGAHYNPIEVMANKIATEGSKARFDEIYRIWRPDGEIRWILDKGFPIYNTQGQCTGVTGVATDITTIKLSEEALINAKKRAEQANRAKSDFLTSITHELRTPLNGLLGNLELIKEDKSNLSDETINVMQSSTQHLLDLIDDLLDVSQLEAGKIDIKSSPLSIHDLLTSVCQQCSSLAKKKNIMLELNIPDNIPSLIGDEKRLRQVIINLIANAIKFTSQNGHVSLNCKNIEVTNDNCNLQISVEDNGIGIPNEMIKTIFKKFSQVSTGLNRKSGGFGIGLAICKEIIDRMNGRIMVRSKLKRGSEFTIKLTLPLERVRHAKLTQNHTEYNVLLIEDHPVNQKVAAAMLKSLNCNADIASDGLTGIKLHTEKNYDFILTDISLPDIDGCEVTRKIRETNHNIPIIAVTAHTDNETKQKCFDAGVNDIIYKPITKSMLNTLILDISEKTNYAAAKSVAIST